MKKRQATAFRSIPSVDSILRREEIQALVETHGHTVVSRAVRHVIDRVRERAAKEPADDETRGTLENLPGLIEEVVRRRTTSTLGRVLNATGVVVHTNLGRAILSGPARDRLIAVAAGYTTLEYDLARGARGSRGTHVSRPLSLLFPGQGALAVNNNAAAVLLALNTLAEGREVVISRGELVEIGGSFRIPDVMAKSGARLREVGTTNRTRLEDYERAIGPGTGLLLKVHTSNYRIIGFTQEAGIGALAELAHRHDLPLMVDQGSGCLPDLTAAGVRDEPTVESILGQGADVVTFSGDKILGGPQSGIILGREDHAGAMLANPLYRVLRMDKLTMAALEATLESYVRGTASSEIPTLRMIVMSEESIARRADEVRGTLKDRLPEDIVVDTVEGTSRVGGGAAPMEALPTRLIRVRPGPGGAGSVPVWEAGLRALAVPVIAIVRDDALLFDLRTVDPEEEDDLIGAIVAVTGRAGAETGL